MTKMAVVSDGCKMRWRPSQDDPRLIFAPRRRSRRSNPVLHRKPEALVEIDFIDASNQSCLLANLP
jgi:hypothetical protein